MTETPDLMEPDDQRAQESLNSTDWLCRPDSLPAVRLQFSHWCRPAPSASTYPGERHLSLPTDDPQSAPLGAIPAPGP